MTGRGEQFWAWVCAQRPAGAVPEAQGADRIVIDVGCATAEVNLYAFDDAEIVEYRIMRASKDDPVFFLHFMLDDMDRAKELFGQLAEALAEELDRTTTKVLLCCTSGFTTTMFAARMSEVAQTLSLDYEFSALPVAEALVTDEAYAVILLAPQSAHMRQQMREAHPNAIVFEIPAKVFGSYDAGSAVRLVMHALYDMGSQSAQKTTLRAVRDLSDECTILIITLFSMRDYSRLGYRLYKSGQVVREGAARKKRFDLRDVEDLLDTMHLRGIHIDTLDAVGIAVPGVTFRGTVTLPGAIEGTYDLGRTLARKLSLPVFVDNNCNAAAVGCYVSQQDYESLVFYRHAFGHPAGGLGTVIDGTLLKGRGNLAGEPKYVESLYDLGTTFDEAIWTADGLHRLARSVSLSVISLIAPEAIYLAVDTVDDPEEFRASLEQALGDAYTPPVHIVHDYIERVNLGELAMVLRNLRDPEYRSLGVGVWQGVAANA